MYSVKCNGLVRPLSGQIPNCLVVTLLATSPLMSSYLMSSSNDMTVLAPQRVCMRSRHSCLVNSCLPWCCSAECLHWDQAGPLGCL